MSKIIARNAACIALVLLLSLQPVAVFAETDQLDAVWQGGGLQSQSATAQNYRSYIANFPNSTRPDAVIEIDASSYSSAEPAPTILDNFEGVAGETILTQDEGFVEYTFNVAEEGFYNITLDYYTYPGRGNDIERMVSINGELPFDNAAFLTFHRMWTNRSEIVQDSRGNDRRPSQVEEHMWRQSYLRDYLGFENEPYLFHFNKGENTIRFDSIKEPLALRKITLCKLESPPTYAEYIAAHSDKSKYSGELIKVQGEAAVYKTAPTIYPLNNRSSPSVEPYHHFLVQLNTIGGDRWKMPLDEITWKIDVPESGMYQIHIKYIQNLINGGFVVRNLKIDGETPFSELKNIRYNYENRWRTSTLADEAGEAFWIYLEAGERMLSMEVVLGDLAEILSIANESLLEINWAYRQMMMIVGSTPDTFRDYQLDRLVPEAIEVLGKQAEIIASLEQRVIELNGQRGERTAPLGKLAVLLAMMYERPDNIPLRWAMFRDSISSLGTWILMTKESPLEIDYILLSDGNTDIPRAQASFFSYLLHEVRALIASFTQDFSAVGDIFDEDESITVWVQSGRDQAAILKQMIDDDFITNTGIPVNIRLVNASMILPATVTGTGPDVVLQMANGDPVNYAMRNAAAKLNDFEGFEEALLNFHPSALESYTYNGNVYALPETQTFYMMFVREDILSEMGIELPRTWHDFFVVLTEVQKNHMDAAIPTDNINDISFYLSLVTQNNGEIYVDNGRRAALDSKEGTEAFKLWTELYAKFGSPLIYNFVNRFRTGEMPIGFADYTTFNTLSVFAPEIRGLWQFYPMPGFEDENGNIDNTVVTTGTASMILETSEKKDESWEFLKWWTSTETQTTYGREMESLLGSAARYATANIHAVENLSWTTHNHRSLMAQWNDAIGMPQVPGGYYTPWHITNAFRNVVYNGDDPQEMIIDYVEVINREITAKRLEFGLPVD